MNGGRPEIRLKDKSQIEFADQHSAVTPPRVSILDSEVLRKQVGIQVSVEGVVSRVASSKNGGVVFMNFETTPPEGFTAVVMLSQIASIESSLGGNLDAALPGRRVVLTGPLSLYGNTPQIEIKRSDQIKVVP